MNINSLSEDDLIKKSGDFVLCKRILEDTEKLLVDSGFKMSEPQRLSLVSHISAMVYRSLNKEYIQALDKDLFNEVSRNSIELATQVCSMLDDLHEDEKYLLSIHFEAAK